MTGRRLMRKVVMNPRDDAHEYQQNGEFIRPYIVVCFCVCARKSAPRRRVAVQKINKILTSVIAGYSPQDRWLSRPGSTTFSWP